jgi:RNA:NAD 2'-phosphotransferase (TPT1/KptA family)
MPRSSVECANRRRCLVCTLRKCRHGSEHVQVLIYIDVPKAMAEGIRFFFSDNNVVLSEGISHLACDLGCW